MGSSPPIPLHKRLNLPGEEDDIRCFSCQSDALIVDWKQGDRICTDCGVVNEERIQDTTHEWKVRL